MVAAVNSGPPSVAHLSGMPNVTNVCRRQSISPFEPSCPLSIIGQLKYLSTMTRLLNPLCWKKSAQILWNGYTGVVGGNSRALGCEGAMVLQ